MGRSSIVDHVLGSIMPFGMKCGPIPELESYNLCLLPYYMCNAAKFEECSNRLNADEAQSSMATGYNPE